jgi:ABC-type uncharacterized transport system auxiliary subunit
MGKADTPITLRLAPRFAVMPAQPDSRSVTVAMVQAAGDAGRARYVYIDPARPAEINGANSLFWENPPPRELERALVAGLRTRFGTVAGPDISIATDLRVLTELEQFEEVSGVPGRAVIAFRTTVIAHGKIAQTGTYCATAPFAGPAPSDRARAFEQALTAAVTAFVQELAAGSAVSSTGSC